MTYLVKPSRRNISLGLVAPEWQWFWKNAVVAVPLLHPGAGAINLVDRRSELLFSGASQTTTKFGLASKRTARDHHYLFSGYSPIVTSDGAGTGDFTLIGYLTLNEFANNFCSLIEQGVTEAYQARGAKLEVNGQGDASNAGFIAFRVRDSTNHSTIASSSAVFAAGDTLHLIATRVGSTMNLYLNGNLHVGAGKAVRDITDGTNDLTIGGNLANDVGTRGIIGDIYMVAGLNIGVTAQQAKMLADDPFGPFRATNRIRLFVPAVAAGGDGTDMPWPAFGMPPTMPDSVIEY